MGGNFSILNNRGTLDITDARYPHPTAGPKAIPVLKPKATLLVGVAVSALCVWLALRNTDFRAIGAALGGANWLWLVPFLIALAAFCVVKAVRWSMLLEPRSSPRPRILLPPVLIGYLGTALMPMQLGEVLRAYVAARRLELHFATVLSSLVVERVLDVLSLALLLAAGILVSALDSPMLIAGASLAVFSLLLMLLLSLAARHAAWTRRAIMRLARPLPARLGVALVSHAAAALEGLNVLQKPRQLLRALLLSLVQWGLMWSCVWFTLRAFDLSTPPEAALAVLAALVIGMMLPAGPGYIGNFQLAFSISLAPFGISNADAVAASLVYHVALWAPLVVAGLVCLRYRHQSLWRLVEEERQEETETQRLRTLRIDDLRDASELRVRKPQ